MPKAVTIYLADDMIKLIRETAASIQMGPFDKPGSVSEDADERFVRRGVNLLVQSIAMYRDGGKFFTWSDVIRPFLDDLETMRLESKRPTAHRELVEPETQPFAPPFPLGTPVKLASGGRLMTYGGVGNPLEADSLSNVSRILAVVHYSDPVRGLVTDHLDHACLRKATREEFFSYFGDTIPYPE